MDAYYLDTFLEIFSDGVPRDNIPPLTGTLTWVQSRVDEKLVKDGYLKRWGRNGNGYIITSEGKLHLEKGGYRRQLIYQKLTPITFWLSFISVILSIIAVIRSF